MPFAQYENWEDCIKSNKDKRNPQAYCGKIESIIRKRRESNKMSNRELITANTVKYMKKHDYSPNDLSAIREISNTEISSMIFNGTMSNAQANQLSQEVTIREVQRGMRK